MPFIAEGILGSALFADPNNWNYLIDSKIYFYVAQTDIIAESITNNLNLALPGTVNVGRCIRAVIVNNDHDLQRLAIQCGKPEFDVAAIPHVNAHQRTWTDAVRYLDPVLPISKGKKVSFGPLEKVKNWYRLPVFNHEKGGLFTSLPSENSAKNFAIRLNNRSLSGKAISRGTYLFLIPNDQKSDVMRDLKSITENAIGLTIESIPYNDMLWKTAGKEVGDKLAWWKHGHKPPSTQPTTVANNNNEPLVSATLSESRKRNSSEIGETGSSSDQPKRPRTFTASLFEQSHVASSRTQ